MLPLRGKSTYPGCSDFRNHLSNAEFAVTVACIPDGLSGKRMAIYVADLARAAIPRRGYEDWWQALDWVSGVGWCWEGCHGSFSVTSVMPKVRPWVRG